MRSRRIMPDGGTLNQKMQGDPVNARAARLPAAASARPDAARATPNRGDLCVPLPALLVLVQAKWAVTGPHDLRLARCTRPPSLPIQAWQRPHEPNG